MSKGVNHASGMMAINDLARIFRSLNDDSALKDSAKFDLMFILTPGSGLDYEITGNFLTSLN
jgi:hypothetical protein